MTRSSNFASALLCAICLLPTMTFAQETRERASLMLGAFITDRDSNTRLDSDQGQGTDINLQDDLGLKRSLTVARLGGYYWMTPRQRLDFSFFDFSRSATRPIDETIEFGDQTFNINTSVSTQSDLSILKAAYTFAVINRARSFLGLTGGLYVAQTKLTLSESAAGTFESEDLTAPLPVVGIRGEYELTERITFRGSGEWFRIDTGDVDGRLSDLQVGLDYRFNERMALGLSYNDVSMNIGASETGGYEGRVDWAYDGFLLFFKWDLGSQSLPAR